MYEIKKKISVHCPENTVLFAIYYICARQTTEQTRKQNLKLKPSLVERENAIPDAKSPSNKQFKSLDYFHVLDKNEILKIRMICSLSKSPRSLENQLIT